MKPHVISAFVLWAVLTAIGELLATLNLFPVVGSKEAEDFDDIFRFLLFLGVPVFSMVVSIVVYSFLRFRSGGTPTEDGPAFRGTGMIPRVWLAVTGGLAVFVMIYPGLWGLAQLQRDKTGYGWGETTSELTLKVTGFQWNWSVEYPEQGITITPTGGQAIVLPVNKTIRFDGTALDVIHSMWIPAFRMRIDVLPGKTTHMEVTPDRLGSYDDDEAYRLQCSQLCGLDHAKMKFPVRVVTDQEFADWVTAQKAKSGK